MLVVNERTMGRLKAFDGYEDALVNLKQRDVLKQTKPFSLPGKLNASWEPIGGSFHGMQGWVAISLT